MLACEKVTQDDRMIDLHSIYVIIEQEKFLLDASRAISLAQTTFKLHNDHYQGQLMQNSRALKAFISQIEGFAGIEELSGLENFLREKETGTFARHPNEVFGGNNENSE